MPRLTLLLACSLLSAATPVLGEAPAPRLEREALETINAARVAEGLPSLSPDPRLTRLARKHSSHMLGAGELSHQGVGGADLAHRAREAGIEYRMVGENVAMNHNQPRPVEAAVRGWLRSPGHRANIMEAEFSHTGLGVVGQGNTYYFTQIFLRPPP